MAIRRARSFWLVAAASVLVVWTAAARRVPAASSQAAPGARPNVVVVLVDDMGWSDIGPFGSEIATPSLDALAGRGVRFTQVYATPRCSPTRASLLTGLYSHQAGMGHLDNVILRGSPGTTGRLGHPRRLFHAFRDDLFGGEVSDLPCELDFVVGRDLPCVGDLDLVAIEFEHLDERNLVALDLALLNLPAPPMSDWSFPVRVVPLTTNS